MNLFVTTFITLVSFAAVANGASMIRQEAEAGAPCQLTGTYQAGTDIFSCDTITVGPLTVPGKVMLDLSRAKTGATINFVGTTTFGTAKWTGPLVWISGNHLTSKVPANLTARAHGTGVRAHRYFARSFFRMATVLDSTISGFTIKNSPFHTFSIVDCKRTTLSGLTLDSSDGHGIDKNTDGFDLASNEYVTIIDNNIFNHDDCIAVTSGIHTIFSGNECTESHGISIGSVGGNLVDDSTTVSDFVAQDNTITNSLNGLRIKAVADLKGMVDNVKFINNHLENVKNAISIHSNYNRATGGYSGNLTRHFFLLKGDNLRDQGGRTLGLGKPGVRYRC
ncbi:unnamed protein product [Peronospora belbahrii]|uniref:endo-polygalacturonase n=1 Tax=Peronospora belbahrii TaxID=622444 RepID=A0ABN8D2Y1_9STRA|nr:unnamed protein product [Peronospora belbahrii]